MASGEQHTEVASQGPKPLADLQRFKYSNRVVLKSKLERTHGGLSLVGQKVVVGGWVKTSKEVGKEIAQLPQPQANDGPSATPGPKDFTCVEIIQSRIPFFRSIFKILSGVGGSGAGGSSHPIREKSEPASPTPPPASAAYLLVNDGSCVSSLQVLVDSSLADPSQLLPTGTCILVEGELRKPQVQGKRDIELRAEKILHIGTVDREKYPLSKKKLPLYTLRDFFHFRHRTTTVATVMRIRSALTFATHTFFQNQGFLYVQVPIITTTDSDGFSEKFQVTTLLSKAGKRDQPSFTDDAARVSLETIKAAIKEKSNLVEELKKSDSDKETPLSAQKDLLMTSKLASQLESKEKSKSETLMKADKVSFSEDFFSEQTYLTVSGRLHLESYACSLGNVYTFGPRFRAIRGESAKNAAEMSMVEAEVAFSQLEDAMNCANDYFKFLCKWVLENCAQDMKFVSKRIDKEIPDRLQSMLSQTLKKISYGEAVCVLQQVTERTFETKLEWGVGLTAEHLSYLADDMYKRPVIVYDYPKDVKPFYVRRNDDGNTVAAFDMVVPKVGTIICGSQNEERIDVLCQRIEALGLAREQYEWYLDLRRHGTVKHSGFSFGFDLMVLFATGLMDVRDAIPFPRTFGKIYN